MKRICWLGIGILLVALSAAAQDSVALDQAKKALSAAQEEAIGAQLQKMAAEAKVIGPERIMLSSPVIGAPYSADEVTTFTQTLSDGTHIQREDRATVYRDGQGRVRRETPREITIMDPVAGVAYNIGPNQGAARKMMVMKTGGGPGFQQMTATYQARPVSGDAAAEMEVLTKNYVGPIPPEKATAGDVAKTKTVAGATGFVFGSAGDGPNNFVYINGYVDSKTSPSGQSLGTQSIEGVVSEGTGTTETIPAGAIGNDKPIQVVNERWYSSELKTLTMTKHSDPRTGEEVFRLTNIRRGEPSPDLFQAPAGCTGIGPCTAKQE